MEKITLNLGDILQLENEINGLITNKGEVIYEGFLKQKLSLSLKFDLQDTADFLLAQKRKIDLLRDELILKYGYDDGNGGTMITTHLKVYNEQGEVIGTKENENFKVFEKEYGEFLSKEIEIEFPTITTDDIKDAGKSKDDYRVLFKLVKKGTL